MKTNELRIGNVVGHGALHTGIGRDNKDYYTVKELKETVMFFNESNTGEYYQDVQPIHLTEEWLLKFGFITHDNHDYFIDISSVCDIHSWFSVFKADDFYYIDVFDIKIRYVHQLQNLYFALTGEELEILKTV